MRRPGFALTEVVVAVALLAVGAVAMPTMATGETRGVGMTEERHLAAILLAEMEAAFGGAPMEFYATRGLPPPPAPGGPDTFTDLHRTLLEDHPAVTALEPLAEAGLPEVREALRASMTRMQVRRSLDFEAVEIGGGLPAGVVTFRVRFTDRQGRELQVSSHQVVYPAGGA